MEKYEVIEHMERSNEGENSYIISALNFILPTYLKFRFPQKLLKGSEITFDSKSVYYEKIQSTDILECKKGSEITIDIGYDIKYTGGYSIDGRTIFIDRNFPASLDIGGKTISTLESIGRHHELTEKWLTDDAYEYPYAHEIADSVERHYVESLGIDWTVYSNEVGKHLHETYARKLQRSPKNLDLSPYVYSHDNQAIEEIRKSMEI